MSDVHCQPPVEKIEGFYTPRNTSERPQQPKRDSGILDRTSTLFLPSYQSDCACEQDKISVTRDFFSVSSLLILVLCFSVLCISLSTPLAFSQVIQISTFNLRLTAVLELHNNNAFPYQARRANKPASHQFPAHACHRPCSQPFETLQSCPIIVLYKIFIPCHDAVLCWIRSGYRKSLHRPRLINYMGRVGGALSCSGPCLHKGLFSCSLPEDFGGFNFVLRTI